MRTMLLGLFSATVLGCVGDSPAGGDAGKMTGEEGGPCFSDFTCKTGFVCDKGPNTCVKPGTDGAVVDTGADNGMTPGDGGNDAATDSGLPCLKPALGYWSGNGNSNDFFGATNLAITNNVGFGTGVVNQGFAFGGTGWLKSSATMKFSGIPSMTVEFWLMYKIANMARRLVFYGNMGSQAMVWMIQNNGTLDILDFSINNVGSVNLQVPTDNIFHHVAFTLANGSTITSFLDGKVINTGAAIGQIPATNAFLAVGGDDMGGLPFDGTIDELAIYSAALSQMEIKATFDARTNGRCRSQ